jgi:hypothetical protein
MPFYLSRGAENFGVEVEALEGLEANADEGEPEEKGGNLGSFTVAAVSFGVGLGVEAVVLVLLDNLAIA